MAVCRVAFVSAAVALLTCELFGLHVFRFFSLYIYMICDIYMFIFGLISACVFLYFWLNSNE